jgi:hypothetical protein
VTRDALMSDPFDFWLEIPAVARVPEQADGRTAWSRWNSWLNRTSLAAVGPWLEEALGVAVQTWPPAQPLSPFWEALNGTALVADGVRIVLLPSDGIDTDELRIPREWVDLPEWAADYYLAVQVYPDDGLVRLWGYIGGEALSRFGQLDVLDQCYTLRTEHLVSDLCVLAAERQLGLVPRRPHPRTLHIPDTVATEPLLDRLAGVAVPRLAVPFDLWAACFTRREWRERLHARRGGLPCRWPVFTWLKQALGEAATAAGWQLLPPPGGALGAAARSSLALGGGMVRQLRIAGQAYDFFVEPGEFFPATDEYSWRFRLTNPTGRVPGGFKLRLLTSEGESFADNEAVAPMAVDQLFVEVALGSGEGLIWEIEPLPENYEREVLFFDEASRSPD